MLCSKVDWAVYSGRQAYAGAAREPCPRGQVDWRPSGAA